MQAADILSITLSQLATNPRRLQHGTAPTQFYPGFHPCGGVPSTDFDGFTERHHHDTAAFTIRSPVGCSSTGSTPASTPSSDTKRYSRKSSKNKELLRCKRRLDFNNNSGGGNSTGRSVLTKPLTPAVQRRNERERNRVRLINMTFATLRQHLPPSSAASTAVSTTTASVNHHGGGGGGHNMPRKQKMSKVDTLKSAIDYIKYMQELLDKNDAVDAAFRTGTVPVQSAAYQRPSIILSPSSMSVSSPGSESASDTDNFLADEDDLLDFSSWFN